MEKKYNYAYVKNQKGIVFDIPIEQLEETLKRKGFEFVCYVEDDTSLIEELFKDELKQDEN